DRGRELTAIEIQRLYARAVREAAGEQADEQTADVLRRWEETLDRLEQDPMQCAAHVEWVAKLRLLDAMRARDGLQWDAPKLAALDLQVRPLQVEGGEFRGVPLQPVPGAHRVQEPKFGDPLHVGGALHRVLFEPVEGLLPSAQHIGGLLISLLPRRLPDGAGVEALDLDGGELAPVGEPQPRRAGGVVADGRRAEHRVGEGELPQVLGHLTLLEQPQDRSGGADLEVRGYLQEVRISDDDVQAAVFVRVRVRLIPGIDDRAA